MNSQQAAQSVAGPSAAPAAVTAAAASATAAVTAIKDRIQAIAGGGAVAVAVVLTMLLIVAIIAYIVWRLNSSSLTATDVIKDPVRLSGAGTPADGGDSSSDSPKKMPYTLSAAKLPTMSVGQEFSMSFWLYLNDFQATSNMKLLINRMNGNKGLSGANPVVFLDQTTNKLYVCVATTRRPSTPKTTLDSLLITGGKGNSNNWSYLTAILDYVPMQRWVQVVFTVQDNTLTLYQDGGMYTVASLYDMVDPTAKVTRPTFAACTGDMTVGNSDPTFSSDTTGFVSRVQFFNYALSASQVAKLYATGPTNTNLLRSLGVPEYGVRSPVYRIDE